MDFQDRLTKAFELTEKHFDSIDIERAIFFILLLRSKRL